MSEFDKLSFDQIPLGNAPAEPLVLPPSFHRTDLMPLPKPTVPVEPRSATPTLKSVEVPLPRVEATVPEPAKAPVPGRIAWVPEALRQMVRPSRSKGVMAAGAASLAAGIAVAHWMWPAPQPKTEPVAAVVPVAEPPAWTAPTLEKPVAVAPLMPATGSATPADPPVLNLNLHAPMDTALRHAGGIEPPVVPVPTAPVVPAPPLVTVPMTPAPTVAATTTPAITVAPTAPPLSGLTMPTPTVTAEVPPLPVIGALPTPKIEAKTTEIPKLVELPKVGTPTMDVPPLGVPKIEIAQPPVMPEAKPKVEPVPLIRVEEKPKLAPPVAEIDLSKMPPPMATDGWNKQGETPKMPAPVEPVSKPPQVLPTIEMKLEPRAVAPTVRPSAAPPREDFDVDVHYATANDTYASISKQRLEDDRYADALRAYNGNRAVVTGQPVDVPPIHVLRKQYAQLIAAPRAVMPSAGEIIPASRSTGGLKSYDIPAGGLTLKALAKSALGDEDLWGRIWDLNPRLKPDDPIAAGTRVRMPGDSRLGE